MLSSEFLGDYGERDTIHKANLMEHGASYAQSGTQNEDSQKNLPAVVINECD